MASRRRKGALAAAVLASLSAHAVAGVPAAGSVSAEARPDDGLLFIQTLDQRIADISWRLASANAQLCDRRMSGIGISLHNAVQYAPAYRQAAIDTFGFGDGLPAVLAIAKAGPGEAAGLKVGDRIAAIDGERIAPSRPGTGKDDYAPISAMTARLEQLPVDRPARLEILRGDTVSTITVAPASICRSRVEVVPGGQINASSNGLSVQVYGKLALWTKTDDELALIIAHEMAHNILDHNRRIEREKIGTGIFASLGRDGRKMRDIEREADRYGLYLVARAGYDYRVAPDFWRRLANTSGLGGVWATTHPTASNRAEFNRSVVAEIDGKIGNADLVP